MPPSRSPFFAFRYGSIFWHKTICDTYGHTDDPQEVLYSIFQLSNEKNPGWLGYLGDYTTQLYGDYNKPLPSLKLT